MTLSFERATVGRCVVSVIFPTASAVARSSSLLQEEAPHGKLHKSRLHLKIRSLRQSC